MSDKKFCVFCDIIEKNGSNILFQDNDLIVIKDIRPVAKYHFLIIPKQHIANAKSLTWKDKPLILNMKARAKSVIEEKNVDMEDTRFVFHWPPFQSVSHLHLHAIAPASEMTVFHRIVFLPGTWWCVSVEYVLERISKDGPKNENEEVEDGD